MTGPRPPVAGRGPELPSLKPVVSPDRESEKTTGAQCGLFGSTARPVGCHESPDALLTLCLLDALRGVRARQLLMHHVHGGAPVPKVDGQI